MPNPYRAPNGRIIRRSGSGRFRESTLADIGLAADRCPWVGCGQTVLRNADEQPVEVCASCGRPLSKPIDFDAHPLAKLSSAQIDQVRAAVEATRPDSPFANPARMVAFVSANRAWHTGKAEALCALWSRRPQITNDRLVITQREAEWAHALSERGWL